MKIKEKLSLNGDVEFVNIDLECDTKLFIEPLLITENKNNEWCIEASRTLDSFFAEVVNACKSGNSGQKLYKLLEHGHGMPELRIGYAKKYDSGSTPDKLREIFSKAVPLIRDGIITSPSELKIYIEHFSADRLSDLCGNVLRKHIHLWTLEQCRTNNIPLSKTKEEIGWFWDEANKKWEKHFGFALKFNNKALLLTPKIIVLKNEICNTAGFIQHIVLKSLQDNSVREHEASSHKKTKKELYNENIKWNNKKRISSDHVMQIPKSADDYRKITIQKAKKMIKENFIPDN